MNLARKVFIVIPAYNESSVIADVLFEIKKHGYENIIVIDDGSHDDTYQKTKSIDGIVALRHKINRGKGAATKTGIEAAKLLGADIIVTMDADGQHDPKDIENIIKPIQNNQCDVVLGTRIFNKKEMPIFNLLANHFGNFMTWYLFGLWVRDSQSGFRAYSSSAAHTINTRGDRYEYESEVIREIYIHKLKYHQVPIQIRYTDYSTGKVQKQSMENGFKTLYKMAWKLLS